MFRRPDQSGWPRRCLVAIRSELRRLVVRPGNPAERVRRPVIRPNELPRQASAFDLHLRLRWNGVANSSVGPNVSTASEN
jgi:hypothetical protein